MSPPSTSASSVTSQNIIVRPAQPHDIPPITTIYNYEIIHTASLFNYDPVTEEDRLEWLETTRGAGYPVVVAVHKGREDDSVVGEAETAETVVGYCSLGPLKAKAGYRKYVHSSVRLQLDENIRCLC